LHSLHVALNAAVNIREADQMNGNVKIVVNTFLAILLVIGIGFVIYISKQVFPPEIFGVASLWLGFWGILGGFIGAGIQGKQGHSMVAGFLIGFLLGPCLVWLLFLQSSSSKGLGLKKCPYCAEYVKPEAVICKHCQKEFPKTVMENN
jgi:hypothetical protein